MADLQWGAEADKIYESGISRGVLYLSDGSAIPWNGLTKVSEKNGIVATSAYFGGRKTHDIVQLSPFQGTVSAYTYPDILEQPHVNTGAYLDDQPRHMFSLSWTEGLSDGNYKIHVVGNANFEFSKTAYKTNSEDAEATEFQWEIRAPRIQLDGLPPTAKLVVDTRYADPAFMTYLEEILYGSVSQNAGFTDFETFLSGVASYTNLSITDNGDGTWTADTSASGYITDLPSIFGITGADTQWIVVNESYSIGSV